jgi:dienelactone hydrolase
VQSTCEVSISRLTRIEPGLKFPSVIYLHGCSGLDLENQSRTIGGLLRAGFAVIAPDSYALRDRRPVCGLGSRHVFSVRAAEAQFAAERARALAWVDARNLFPIGHSEGGAGAAAYRGEQFNAIVISGFHCSDGVASSVPPLAIAHRGDPWVQSAAGFCPGATEKSIREGTSHHPLRHEVVAERVVAFLKRNLTNQSALMRVGDRCEHSGQLPERGATRT